MPIDPDDPKMKGFVPLNPEWAADCPDMASRRVRDESHFSEEPTEESRLPSATNDTEAAALGVKLYAFYQNAGVVRQRLV